MCVWGGCPRPSQGPRGVLDKPGHFLHGRARTRPGCVSAYTCTLTVCTNTHARTLNTHIHTLCVWAHVVSSTLAALPFPALLPARDAPLGAARGGPPPGGVQSRGPGLLGAGRRCRPSRARNRVSLGELSVWKGGEIFVTLGFHSV